MVDLPHGLIHTSSGFAAVRTVLAPLAVALVMALPRLDMPALLLGGLPWVYMPATLDQRLRAAPLIRRHAPMGVLLLGCLANAGGLAFRSYARA